MTGKSNGRVFTTYCFIHFFNNSVLIYDLFWSSSFEQINLLTKKHLVFFPSFAMCLGVFVVSCAFHTDGTVATVRLPPKMYKNF